MSVYLRFVSIKFPTIYAVHINSSHTQITLATFSQNILHIYVCILYNIYSYLTLTYTQTKINNLLDIFFG